MSNFEFRHSHRRGVVMILTLLALILLVSLVLFTLNMGQQVDRRVVAQTSADATAAAGATWVARSLNVVAMNNIAIAHDIALVAVMDSMPTATHFSLLETTAMRDALAGLIGRGLNNAGPAQLTTELNTLMSDYQTKLQDQIDLLQPVDQFFQAHDLTPITWYNPTSTGNGGHGALWREMTAMDELNQATIESLGTIAQTTAVLGGHATQDNEQHADAFLTPLVPAVPTERGSFSDFELPVKVGTLPAAVDDETENRGPYDTVFGYHGLISQTTATGGTWVPGTSDVAQGGHGSVPIGSGASSSGGHMVGQTITTTVTGYYVWGAFQHLLDEVDDYAASRLPTTRMGSWARQLSLAKLYYLWPDQIPSRVSSHSWPPASVTEPQWVIDFNQAVNEAAAGKVKETAFFAIEIKSRYPVNDPNFLSPGSWTTVTDNGQEQPRLVRLHGWVDARSWGAQQVAQYGWRDTWQYSAWFDNSIGIAPLVDAQGQPVSQPVYRVDHFYFAGVNVGPEYDNPDPFKGFDATAESAPAPTDLNHNLVKRDTTSRRLYLTYLGAAMTDRVSQTWPSRFSGTKPTTFMLAMAQSQVFNNHSWDLWTPMWKTQLQPIRDVSGWASVMNNTGASGLSGELNTQAVNTAKQYLTATAPLGELMSAH